MSVGLTSPHGSMQTVDDDGGSSWILCVLQGSNQAVTNAQTTNILHHHECSGLNMSMG
jgi:hypothetical protein